MSTKKTYLEKLAKASARSEAQVRAAQDIAPVPEVVDPERRHHAEQSLQNFAETYFPDTIYFPWSSAQKSLISHVERVVTSGERYACVLPRGSGKTTLFQIGSLMACFTGKCRFVLLIGASKERSDALIQTPQTWLETNDLLLEDYPEICYPIRCLEHKANRARGQLCDGKSTRIQWKSDRVVFPCIAGSVASEVVLKSASLLGSGIHGNQYARSDGTVARPDLVLIDDPQTPESAISPVQSEKREKTIQRDIIGMVGPGRTMGVLAALTIIEHGDLACSLIDREKHPEWRGEKFADVIRWPDNMDLWDEYRELRKNELRNNGNGSQALEFYLSHRTEMDEGAELLWPENFIPKLNEVSGLQRIFRVLDELGPESFAAQHQADPISSQLGDDMLSADSIRQKINGYERLDVPEESQAITAFIDVHHDVLYYVIAAWQSDFTGSVIDYGTFPEQRQSSFQKEAARFTLETEFPHESQSGRIFSGLESLINKIMGRVYVKHTGEECMVHLCGIDSRWPQGQDAVYNYIMQSPYRRNVIPTEGSYIGAASKPFDFDKKAPGELRGFHWWRKSSKSSKRKIPHVNIDTNFWKTFVHDRFSTGLGDVGSLSLFGTDQWEHQMFSEHMVSEYRVRTQGRERTVDEWREPPKQTGKIQNHYFDCVVGATTLASVLGCKLPLKGGKNGQS